MDCVPMFARFHPLRRVYFLYVNLNSYKSGDWLSISLITVKVVVVVVVVAVSKMFEQSRD